MIIVDDLNSIETTYENSTPNKSIERIKLMLNGVANNIAEQEARKLKLIQKIDDRIAEYEKKREILNQKLFDKQKKISERNERKLLLELQNKQKLLDKQKKIDERNERLLLLEAQKKKERYLLLCDIDNLDYTSIINNESLLRFYETNIDAFDMLIKKHQGKSGIIILKEIVDKIVSINSEYPNKTPHHTYSLNIVRKNRK